MAKKTDLNATVPGHVVGDFVEEFLVPANYDEDGVQSTAAIGRDGKEYGDPVPMAPPIGYTEPPNIAQMIRTMVQRELSHLADDQGFDTFEEAEDFDVDDDEPTDRKTPYEKHFDPPATPPAAGPQEPAQPAPPPNAPEANGGGAAGGPPKAPPPPSPPATPDKPQSTT